MNDGREYSGSGYEYGADKHNFAGASSGGDNDFCEHAHGENDDGAKLFFLVDLQCNF